MIYFKYLELKNGGRAKVSLADFEILNQFNWRTNHHGYASRRKGTSLKDERTILMHREILSAKLGQIVDHVNGDRLDNRRENLRFTTRSKNMMNRQKGVRGVHLRPDGKWHARIGFNMKRLHLGVFKTRERAEAAYVEKAKELFSDHWS